MNGTHLHLLITHLPIFGSLLGALVLAYALYTKSNQTKVAAYGVFVISAIGAAIAYLTGESAEESVEKLQGVIESSIEAHEDFADVALTSMLILGIVSLLGLYVTIRKSAWTRTLAFVILFISLISFGIVARTGYLGGQIRHTEVSGGTAAPLEHFEDHD